MTSFPDEKISSINRISDFNGFEGLRIVIRQGVKDDDLSTRRKDLPYFMIGYRPGEERRSIVAESRGKAGFGIPMKRVCGNTCNDTWHRKHTWDRRWQDTEGSI